MTKIKISVVMSCYNAATTLSRAMDSVLNQTYRNFEFVIIDDGSEDNTLELLRAYEASDSRVVLMKNETNIGLAASLNKGIKRATGQYIARMDADDEAYLDRLEKQIMYLERYPDIDILGSGIMSRSTNNTILKKHILPQNHKNIITNVFKKPLVFHPTIMIKRSVYHDHGYYNPEVTWAEDADLWYRIYDQVIFHNLQEPLLYYTVKNNFRWRHAKYNMMVKISHLRKRKLLLSYAPQLVFDLFNFGRKMIFNSP